MKQKLFALYVALFFSTSLFSSITYELNGGVTNDYGWVSKNDMFQACMTDAGITSIASLDELKAAGDVSYKTICDSYDNSNFQKILDNPKWDWLEAYIMSIQNADFSATALSEGNSSAGWRYAVAAFFLEGKYTSWPRSADFSQAGKVDAFMSAWKHGFDNPTEPTGELVLNIPYNEGETFEGWYTTAEFLGEQVVKIDASTTGTLYAKWTDYTSAVKINPNDANMGSVSGSGWYAKFSELTISATPNFGYYFVQWNDGNTDNPRTLVLTQDITLTAEFAQSFSGMCGDNLYWEVIDTTLHITGSGKMYDYNSNTVPWKLLVSSIKSLTVAEGVTKIGDNAFDSCTELESVVWNAEKCANFVTNSYAPFYDICSNITSFTFGDSVQHIPAYLCYGMGKLTSVIIPNSVTSIGKSAFYKCSSLISITCEAETPPTVGSDAFYKVFESIVYVPCGCVEAYKAANGWKNFTNIQEPLAEYSITVDVNDTIMGTAKVDINSACGNQISATPNFGYHFVQWSDGNTDNPRNLELTQDITLTAEFAHLLLGQCGDSLYWELVDDTLHITGSGDMYEYNTDSIPWKLLVNTIKSVTIAEGATMIGKEAFKYCSSLASVTINSDAIVNKSYSMVSNLSHIFGSQVTEYIIGESVTSIGEGAFSDCSSLTSITIPESVTSIGNYTFQGCSSLTSVTIGNGVTSIGADAFRWCYSLTSVTIPNSVTSIGDYAFYQCTSMTSVTIGNGVTSIGKGAFSGGSSLTSITIPESVTSIGDYAFGSSLTSITFFSETPPTVGQDAFYNVSKSIPIYVPCGCVGAYKAKSGWENFTNIQEPLAEYSITVDVNDTIMGTAKVDINSACGNQISATPNFGYHFVQWSDRNTDNPRTLELTQDTILIAEFAPNTYTITTVSSDTQRGTTQGDTTVNYLDIVTICANASYGYHFVQWNDGNSDNPRQVQVTGDTTYTATFDKNTYAISLSCNEEQGSVEGVTSAEYLDTVTISATPNIGYHFVQWSDGNTDTIRTLVLTQDTTLTAEFAQSFSGQCGDSLYWELIDTTLHITGKGEMYDYKPDSAPWKLLVSSIKVLTIAEDVTMIGYDAFDGCIALVTIVWNAKHAADAYNDGQYNYPVFYGICSQITSFNLGENVEYIPSYLCSGMENLTSVTIPESVTSIGTCAFQDCASLTSVTIPNSVTSIGDGAFYDCSSLTSIIIPSSVTSIGYAAFYNCTSLTSVTIPNSVTSIGDYAFNSCTSLTSVTIPESVTSIGYAAFAYCSSLASVTIPESVTSIGEYAFDGCNNITSVTWNAKNCNTYNFGSQVTSFEFGNEVEVVPSSLCKGMEKLTSVSIPNSVKTIGTSAFEGCARLGKISLGTGLEEIAANAFAGCTRLYDIYVYATYPPFAEESSFANYNVYVYVPCDSKRDYTLDPVWGKFQNIECLSDEPTDMENIETPSQRPSNVQKLLRNGQLIIVRDGVEYNAMGQEL